MFVLKNVLLNNRKVKTFFICPRSHSSSSCCADFFFSPLMDVSISSLLQPNQPKKTKRFDYANSSLTQILHAINLESRDIFGSFRFCADIARITSNSTACPMSSSRQSNLMNFKTEKRKKNIKRRGSREDEINTENRLSRNEIGNLCNFFFFFFFSLCCCSSLWPKITSRQDTPWPRALETL